MKERIRKCPFPLFAGILFLILLMLPLSCAQKKSAPLRLGAPVPPLSFTSITGAQYALPAATEGKLAVVLFWSKGCTYCEKEMPSIEPLYQKYHQQGFEFVAVHVGPGMQEAKEMQKEMGLTFPMVVDESAASRKSYTLVGVPTMFFISPDGTLNEKILGGLSASMIETLLKEKLNPPKQG